jgi:hypothetical protein
MHSSSMNTGIASLIDRSSNWNRSSDRTTRTRRRVADQRRDESGVVGDLLTEF